MIKDENKALEMPPYYNEECWQRNGWLYDPFMKLIFIPFGGESMFRKKIIAFAGPEEGEWVLDACCGTGTLTSLIAEKVGKTGAVIGVDLSTKLLELATGKVKKGLPLTFRQASCTSMPFPDGTFDKVFISFGMHEINADDRLKSLSEVKRVLKTDGGLFILEYNLPQSFLKRFAVKAFNKLFESEDAYRMLLDGTLLPELKQAGFTVKRRQLIGVNIFQILHTEKTS